MQKETVLSRFRTKTSNLVSLSLSNMVAKANVTRDDWQPRYSAEHSVTTLLQHCFLLKHSSNTVAFIKIFLANGLV